MRTVPHGHLSQPIRNARELSLIALVAGLGACSSIDALRSPVFTGSTNNQKQILSGTLAARQHLLTAASVQGGDLPPPAGAPAAPAYASASGYAPAPTYGTAQQGRPQPYIPPQRYAATEAPTPTASSPRPSRARAARRAADDARRAGGPHRRPRCAAQRRGLASRPGRRHRLEHLAALRHHASTSSPRRTAARRPSGSASGSPFRARGASQPQGVQVASLNPSDVPQQPPAARMPEVPISATARGRSRPAQTDAGRRRAADRKRRLARADRA